MRLLSGIVLLLLLASCAGRDAQPVQVVRSSDMQLTCPKLDQEQLLIDSEARKLAGKTDKTV